SSPTPRSGRPRTTSPGDSDDGSRTSATAPEHKHPRDIGMNTQPHGHIVRSLDEEQRRLTAELLRMGEMAAAQLEAALDVVERRDDKAAERVIGNDEALDA